MSKKEIAQRVMEALKWLGALPYERFLMEVLPNQDYTKDRELLLREALADLIEQRAIETDRGWYRIAAA